MPLFHPLSFSCGIKDSGFAYTFKAKLTKNGKVVNPDGSSIGGIEDGGTGDGGDGGDITPDDPETPAAAQKLPFVNNFKTATSLDPFFAFSESGNEAWRISNSGKYKNGAAMSGYNGGAKANVDWLITPALDFTGATAPKLFLNHTIGHAGNVEEEQQVLISKDYVSGDPTKATWTKLTITYPGKPAEGKNFSTTDSETDLSAYAGEKNIHIALKYTSTDQSSSQWQIGKMEVKEATGTKPGTEEPGTEEPGTDPEQPTEGNLLFPGADFEDWTAFTGKLNNFGLKNYATQADDPDQGKVLQIKGTPQKNDYVFTVENVEVKATNPLKITFKMKGECAGKSISINVYDNSGSNYVKYNLGDITTDAKIGVAESNQYNGSINTNGKWITITLDLTGVEVNTSGSGSLFALKVGKEVAWDVMVDDFKIE